METGLEQLETLFRQHGGYLTRRQVDEAGLEPKLLSYLVETGEAERVQRVSTAGQMHLCKLTKTY